MSDIEGVDYGPLTELIGVWKSDKGLDVAPEPDGAEENPYYETITFTAVGDVTNAGSQVLAAIHYRQIVQRKSNDEVFHDETGYWIWDAKAGIIMHSLTIPRAVSVLAGGNHKGEKEDDGSTILEVSAGLDNKDWQIIQAPFMQGNARTTEFHHRITVGNGKLSYSETTIVEIYGKVFEHTDQNELMRQ
ncbi:MAG: FABP family protein [Chloroflexi bacterium]|nr:FABP family protein [Chloroflexota bacterium]